MIKKCPKCSKYTLQNECCEKTRDVHPAKFSIVDKFGKYRRAIKAKG